MDSRDIGEVYDIKKLGTDLILTSTYPLKGKNINKLLRVTAEGKIEFEKTLAYDG